MSSEAYCYFWRNTRLRFPCQSVVEFRMQYLNWHSLIVVNGSVMPWKWFSVLPALSHIKKIIESISIRHRSDAKVSDRCLIDVDPMVFFIWARSLVSYHRSLIASTKKGQWCGFLLLASTSCWTNSQTPITMVNTLYNAHKISRTYVGYFTAL